MKGQRFLTKGQEILRRNVRKLAEEMIFPRASEIEETRGLPPDLKALLAKNGLLGFAFPKEYGGSDGDMVSLCVVAEELSRASGDVAVWCAHIYLGALPIILAGSEEQKGKYLPRITSGAEMCAFGLSEADTSMDPATIRATAVWRGDQYVLNGAKRFLAFGDSADYIAVFARAAPEADGKGVSCFLVEKETPGLRVGRLEKRMGLRAVPSPEVVLEDCAVPPGNIIGGPGEGGDLATRALETVRPLMAAIAVGIAQGALEKAVAYAKERVQFGQPIAQFEAIQFMLAEMATQVEAARLLTYYAAALIDEDDPSATKVVSMAKCFATDMAMKVTTDAVQIHGGYGYMKDLPMERYMREAKFAQIAAGTNQHQRLVVAREILREY